MIKPPFASRPLAGSASREWDQAVWSATARLNAGWIMPETRCDPALAEELAAFLCAYAA